MFKCIAPCAQDVADACRTGAATNIIFGLALGYKSAIVPCLVIAVCIYVSFSLANMYGIACAALGMLTTMSTGARPELPRLVVTGTWSSIDVETAPHLLIVKILTTSL